MHQTECFAHLWHMSDPTATQRSLRRRSPAGGAVLRHVDFEHAHLVAHAYLDAPRGSADPVARVAYTMLGAQADRWFARLTDHRRRNPVRVVFARCAEPYVSGQDLAERVRSERVLEMRPTYYERDRHHPLLDVSIGGTYDRFRAVHDIVSHAHHGFGFDRHGEYSAWLAEDRMYTGLARWALATELHGEHSVMWTTGDVTEHKATLLPRSLVRTSWRLGMSDRQGFVGG